MSIYPPTGTLEIKNATLKIPVVDLQYTSNTAKLEANSNVVTEFSRSKKLIKYPRVALTSAAQTGSGYEGYFVSQDSATLNGTSNRQAWAFFDTQGPGQGTALASPHLVSSTDRFDGNGNYTGGDSLADVSGDWIYIRLPDKIQLQSVDLWARYDNQRNPIDGTVLGSLNGTNWSVIGSWQNAKFESGGSTSFTINSIQYYDYIGFVFEKIEANSSGGYINFHEIDLYGVPEYDPDADGTDVVVKSIPNVPNTDWLEVYYDAKDLADGTVTSVTDLSGNGVTGATSSGGVTVSDGAFVLDGSSDYIESGQTIAAVGTPRHTFSLWVKPSAADMDDTATHYLSVWGSGTVQNGWSGVALTGRGKLAQVYHASGKHTNDVLFSAGRWYHVVVVIKSTVATTAADRDVDFYVDGALYSGLFSVFGSQSGNSAYYLDWGTGTNTSLRLGSLHNGSEGTDSTIANFRLFNRALTSDEIYQLYAYQKEDFGHGDLSMTLKAGRLGIGTSEPRAMLDVKGDTFSKVYKGGRTTFLTWDYVGQRSTSFSAAGSTGGAPSDNTILDYTFTIPSCYHHLGRANLKAHVQIDWRGECEEPWNFGFRIEIRYNGESQLVNSSVSDHSSTSGNKINGLPCISYYANANFDSTPEAASVTSTFALPDCDVSPGSTLKVGLVGRNGVNVAKTVWTGRTKGFSASSPAHELPTTSFFVVLDVDDGY